MLELYNFHVVIPAGILSTAPSTFTLVMPPREVVEIEILVPPGPRGEVGFKIAQAGRQVIPSIAGDFIITDNETLHWPIEGANTSGAWQIIAYNTGAFNHTLEVRFQCNLPGSAAQQATPQPIAPALIGGDASAPAEPLSGPLALSGADVGSPALTPPGLPALPGLALPPSPVIAALPAFALPSLPPPPKLPAPPDLQGQGGRLPTLEEIEARGQAVLEGEARAASAEAAANAAEARGQAARDPGGTKPAAAPVPWAGNRIII